jgi:CheY-like chemotaxis protein
MYTQWLAFSGFRVAEASSGREALEKVRTLRPDIVATDIGLTGDIDGCQLTETLKSYADTHRIPIIAVTAWSRGGQIERARQAGCDAVRAAATVGRHEASKGWAGLASLPERERDRGSGRLTSTKTTP